MSLSSTSNSSSLAVSTTSGATSSPEVRDDCAFSACSHSLLLSIKALAPLVARGGGVGLWTDIHPPPAVAGFWNRANFPFYQPSLSIDFWVVSSWTPSFSNILSPFSPLLRMLCIGEQTEWPPQSISELMFYSKFSWANRVCWQSQSYILQLWMGKGFEGIKKSAEQCWVGHE